jgi:hypothetical protein
MTKVCTKCGKTKSLSEFYNSKKSYDGKSYWCKQCVRIRDLNYRSKNIEKIKAKERKRSELRRKDPIYKAYRQKYRRTNSERMRVSARESTRKRRLNPIVKQAEKIRALAYRKQNLELFRAKDRELMKSRQAWLNSLKENPCIDCGKIFRPCAMDFDHIRGDKFKGVGEMLSYKRDRILSEISKCDLVCANCHRIRSKNSRGEVKRLGRKRFYAKIDVLKNKPCVDCGEIFPPVAMDFDHVRGEKVATIAQMRSWPWDQTLLELSKCELICANCHRVRTQNSYAKKAV